MIFEAKAALRINNVAPHTPRDSFMTDGGIGQFALIGT
jgi:hypothetical protein